MRYQGGKTRLAKAITTKILAHTTDRGLYIEPFLGSAAVAARMVPAFDRAILADAMPDVVHLWQAACNGWIPPENLSLGEYEALRSAPSSALRAFAGFGCSFGGKWFGGYARDPRSDRNYARAASRSIARRAPMLAGAEIIQTDYRTLVVTPGTVLYADPPYANTTAYNGAGPFNSVEFWQIAEGWARSGATVFVSEYTAPSGWCEVWSIDRHTSTALDNRGARAIDRLFIYDP